MICERETVCRTGVRKLSLDGSALPQSIEYILYYVVLYIYIYIYIHGEAPNRLHGHKACPGPATSPDTRRPSPLLWLLASKSLFFCCRAWF